jgi:hypothetical protein
MSEGCQHTESNWSDGWRCGWICIINVKQSLTFVDHIFFYIFTEGLVIWKTLDMSALSLVCVRKRKTHSPTFMHVGKRDRCFGNRREPSERYIYVCWRPYLRVRHCCGNSEPDYTLCWQLWLECLWLYLCLGSLISIWLEVYGTQEESNTQSK